MSTSRKGSTALTIAFIAIITAILTVLTVRACQPEQFEAPEYKGVSTEMTRKVYLQEDPESSHSSSDDETITLTAGMPVTMTGMLWGERGEIAYLYAEVLTPKKGWVPLTALNVINVP